MNPLPVWSPRAFQPPSLVLHPSLPLEWCFGRPVSDYAYNVMLRIPQLVSVVPVSWPLQLAEGALARERAGHGTAATSDQCRAWAYSIQIVVDSEAPARTWTDLLPFARLHIVTIDDAAYLELALRLNLPLATVDSALLRAAPGAGVTVFTP